MWINCKKNYLRVYNKNSSKTGGDFGFCAPVLGTEKKWGGVSSAV